MWGFSRSVPGTGIQAAIFLPRWMLLSLEIQAGLEEKKEACGFWEAGCCCFPGWNLP